MSDGNKTNGTCKIRVVSAKKAEGCKYPCSGSSDGGSSIQPTKSNKSTNQYTQIDHYQTNYKRIMMLVIDRMNVRVLFEFFTP